MTDIEVYLTWLRYHADRRDFRIVADFVNEHINWVLEDRWDRLLEQLQRIRNALIPTALKRILINTMPPDVDIPPHMRISEDPASLEKIAFERIVSIASTDPKFNWRVLPKFYHEAIEEELCRKARQQFDLVLDELKSRSFCLAINGYFAYRYRLKPVRHQTSS